VKPRSPFLLYTVLRLLFLAAPLVGLMLLGVTWMIAVPVAAVVGLCLSYIFLAKPREAVARDIYERRNREKPLHTEDDDIEDEAQDAAAARRPASDEV